MSATKTVRAADLFCGAGGTSSGLALACQDLGLPVDLVAFNHWPIAIETHERNHPWARHVCKSLHEVDPRKVFPERKLTLLVASPECTHHSIARGGRPVSDQMRASAWQIVDWLAALTVDSVLIENVREFRDWGPIGTNGRPLKSRRGRIYQSFLTAIREIGYRVEERILNAADYGDPTTRERLFIIARRANRKIEWPEPSHAPIGSLLPGLKPWRAAREIIDWSLQGQSIFSRPRPMSPNTMARIMAGLKKFGGVSFIVPHRMFNGQQVDSIERPLRTITAKGAGDFGLCEPFLVNLRGTSREQVNGSARSLDEPVSTVAASGGHHALVEPFVLPPLGFYARGGRANPPRSIEQPMQTITSRGGGHVVQPFLVPFYGERNGQAPRTHSLDEPMPTVPASGVHGLVEPFLTDVRGADRPKAPRSVKDPVPTVTTKNGLGLVEAFLVQYNGTADAQSVDEPLRTIPTKDRFALVMVDGQPMALDIRFRMLQPSELAAAMGFPPDYAFAGNRGQRVRQIGNAVAVNVARALCRALLA